MHRSSLFRSFACLALAAGLCSLAHAQMGRRFPSEKKIVVDPVTGVELAFLTSTPAGDSKIYPTHPQWTADGQWIIFRSKRVPGQAMAVNEQSGVLVQVTETGYTGALCMAQKTIRLFFCRPVDHLTRKPEVPESVSRGDDPRRTVTVGKDGKPQMDEASLKAETEARAADARRAAERKAKPRVQQEVVSLDLARLFADSAAGTLKPAASYETVHGVIPLDIGGAGELALDADEQTVYFRMEKEAAAKLLAEGTRIEENFGPRHMGAGPAGVAKMDLRTGAVSPVVVVPFQVGHIQSNPWTPGQVMFCWETGGKSPQRTWVVNGDGTKLRPLFAEASFDWVTHEAFIGPDEAAFAVLGHRPIGTKDEWGECGSRAHPTGLGISSVSTGTMLFVGQTKTGSGFWHVHGSADGRWATGDDFERNLYLIDRRTSEMILISAGHKTTAADHVHPTFSPDSTRISIQSAMLSEDNRTMNICVVPVPKAWLARTYDEKVHPSK